MRPRPYRFLQRLSPKRRERLVRLDSGDFTRDVTDKTLVLIAVRQKIQSQYPSIAERIILMALESVDYCEDKALQILKIVVADKEKEDNQAKVAECQDTG